MELLSRRFNRPTSAANVFPKAVVPTASNERVVPPFAVKFIVSTCGKRSIAGSTIAKEDIVAGEPPEDVVAGAANDDVVARIAKE